MWKAIGRYELMENDSGGRKQHPDTWIQACREVLQEVLTNQEVRPSEVRATGVSGHQRAGALILKCSVHAENVRLFKHGAFSSRRYPG